MVRVLGTHGVDVTLTWLAEPPAAEGSFVGLGVNLWRENDH
jgi:hypothetical protein